MNSISLNQIWKWSNILLKHAMIVRSKYKCTWLTGSGVPIKIFVEKLEDSMKEKLKQSVGKQVQSIMIADFKMKFELISSRVTTLSHYGKRGIGWYGIHLFSVLQTRGA